MINILLMVLYIFLTVSGLTLFKIGSNSLYFAIRAKEIDLHIGFISLVGIGCYIASFILYLILISRNSLSFLVPIMTGIVYIAILTVSFFIFKEKVNVISLLGTTLILFGIVLMVISQGKRV